MIRFSCPVCSAVLSVSDDAAGKKGSCPKCRQRLQVPSLSPRNQTMLGINPIHSGSAATPLPTLPAEADWRKADANDQSTEPSPTSDWPDADDAPQGMPSGTKFGLIALGVVSLSVAMLGIALAANANRPHKVAEVRYTNNYHNSPQKREKEVSFQVTEESHFNPIVFVVVLALYFLPTCIAFMRRHQNAAAILVLNLLLGWTFIGWIASIVWSLTASWNDEKSFRRFG